MLLVDDSTRIFSLPDDVWNVVHRFMSVDAYFNLSLTCHNGNKKFNDLVLLENIAHILITIHSLRTCVPIFPFFPWITHSHRTKLEARTEPIVIALPGFRREMFTVCGKNGHEYAKQVYGTDRYFDRQRIADGESIESIKKDRANKLDEIKGLLNDPTIPEHKKNQIRTVLSRQPVLDQVLDGIFDWEDAYKWTMNCTTVVNDFEANHYATRYQLTKQQVQDIIVNQFNPLSSEIIRLALDKKYLRLDQVLLLKEVDIASIQSRPCKRNLLRWNEDSPIFLATVEKYHLTPEQAVKLITISWHGKNPLYCEKKLQTTIRLQFVSLDQALTISREQARLIDFKKFEIIHSKFKLTQEQEQELNFAIITKNANHLCELEGWVINEGVLTLNQAINLPIKTRDSQFLKKLKTCKEKYALTTEQVSEILRLGASDRSISLTNDDIQWAIKENLLSIDRAIRCDYRNAAFLEHYRRFLDKTNLSPRSTENSKVAALTARNLIHSIAEEKRIDIDTDLEKFQKKLESRAFESNLAVRLQHIVSGRGPNELIADTYREYYLRKVKEIFDDLLTLYIKD